MHICPARFVRRKCTVLWRREIPYTKYHIAIYGILYLGASIPLPSHRVLFPCDVFHTHALDELEVSYIEVMPSPSYSP